MNLLGPRVYDLITREKLSTAERWLAAAVTFVPWVRTAYAIVDVVQLNI
ncbi:pre-toxin TG domain-containing protein [Paenibacillus sp. GCM10027627]